MSDEPVELTRENVLASMRKAVELVGENYVYPVFIESGCLYVEHDRPSCLVAHVLYDLGVPLEEMKKHEGIGVRRLMNYLHHDGIAQIQRGVADILGIAQDVQDYEGTWGRALEASLNY